MLRTVPVLVSILFLCSCVSDDCDRPGNYVGVNQYHCEIDCLDQDGDGATFGVCSAPGPVDCNDDVGLRGADESPGFDERDDPSLWYDGLDNDCSYNGVGTEHDVIDFDGDGFPGIAFDNWVSEGFAKDWPQNLPTDPLSVDCDDRDDAVNPQRVDSHYDGIDSDCAGDDDFDADGDGYVPTQHYAAYLTFSDEPWFTGLATGDCDDSKPNVHPASATPDQWYDGIDQDCAGNNDFDRDADGFVEVENTNQCAAYNLKYGYELSCSADDCDDLEAAINPGAVDYWYDGIDSNCDGFDDFDADEDGWIPSAYAGTYAGLSALPWHAQLLSGDCNDVDASVHPGALEVVGDGADTDCDGQIDGSAFAFGGYGYEVPRQPVVTVNAGNYLLAVAADRMTSPDGDTTPSDPDDEGVGAVLHFELDAGHMAQVSNDPFFQNVNGGPMGDGIDLIADGAGYFVGYSYLRGGKDWLLVKRATPGSGTSTVYTNALTDARDADMDLSLDDSGGLWAASCSAQAVHFLNADSASMDLIGEGTAQGPGFSGSSCWLDTADGVRLNAVADDVPQAYLLDAFAQSIEVDPAGPSFSAQGVDEVRAHGGWVIWSEGAGGVTVVDDNVSFHHDFGAAVLDADAAFHEGVLYIAAVTADVDGDGLNDVLLGFGDPLDPMVPAIVAHEHPSDAQEPMFTSLHVDHNRLVVAVASQALSGSGDAVGWMFLGMP